ncbi:hypothetical protein E4U61_002523 [Claviceps capensis]|nr:hypothetical protein E4U61_002523 [Claviceps capensis]
MTIDEMTIRPGGCAIMNLMDACCCGRQDLIGPWCCRGPAVVPAQCPKGRGRDLAEQGQKNISSRSSAGPSAAASSVIRAEGTCHGRAGGGPSLAMMLNHDAGHDAGRDAARDASLRATGAWSALLLST